MKLNFFNNKEKMPATPKVEQNAPVSTNVEKLADVLQDWKILTLMPDASYAGDNDRRNKLLEEIKTQSRQLSAEEYQRACDMAELGDITRKALDIELREES